MPTFAERADLTDDLTLLARVQAALVRAAIAIANEADTTPNHVPRIQFARRVLHDPITWARVMVHGVVDNSNVGIGGNDDPTSPTGDSALEYVISSIWDAYA